MHILEPPRLPDDGRSYQLFRAASGLLCLLISDPAADAASCVVQFGVGSHDEPAHLPGLAHLLELPEYQSLDRAQPLMSYLSEDSDPARFPVPKDDPMKILIGPENVADALKDTSVVVASYDIGEGMRGVIGVVGPTRMDYAKITARLSYLAEGLSRLFGQGELPQGRDDEK